MSTPAALGPLTILVTDVVGSTSLHAALGETTAREIVESREGIVRHEVQSAGGRVVKTMGDGVMAAFNSPRRAVSCALAIQRRVAAGDVAEARLRIGLHIGEVDSRAGDVRGTAVNAAFRIADAAGADQVLVSEAMRQLCTGAEELAFEDQGEFDLKGFDDPWRLYVAGGTSSAEAAAGTAAEPPATAHAIRALVVDDEGLVRAGFRMILSSQPDIEVVGEASDGAEAIEKARELSPDIVLMDIRMAGMDGLEATRQIQTEIEDPPQVIVLTTFDLDEYVYDALRAGASGFLLKDTPAEDLVAAVRVVASGAALIQPTVTRRLIEQFVRSDPRDSTPPEQLASLSDREIEVLRLLARGASNAEIAEELVVSASTVKTHVAHILEKLGVRDRVQAVVVAFQSGLMS